ncbi:MAG: RsbRD N-terminal domain-containing protein [Rhodospirillales bacterium]
MLSAKLIRLISTHREEITARVIRRIRRESGLLELGKLPEAELRERALSIFENLDTWLTAKKSDLAQTYEELGRLRCEQGVPLHETVHGMQIIKETMIQFVQDQRMTGNTLEIYAEEELEHATDRIFDLMIFHLVRGYENAMWRRVAQ